MMTKNEIADAVVRQGVALKKAKSAESMNEIADKLSDLINHIGQLVFDKVAAPKSQR